MKYLFGLFTAILMISCSSNKKLTNPNSILQNKWELMSINGDEVSLKSPVTIEFNKENQFFGYAGCNHINGNYNFNENSDVKFSKISSTRMMCSKDINDFEFQFITNLEKADKMEIDGNKLYIKNVNNEMIFHKINHPELSGKTWIYEDNFNLSQSVESSYVTFKSNNEITGFNGCNYFFGSYNLKNNNQIEIDRDLSISAKLCNDIDDKYFMDILKNTKFYKISNRKLYLIDSHNKTIGVFK